VILTVVAMANPPEAGIIRCDWEDGQGHWPANWVWCRCCHSRASRAQGIRSA